VILDECTYRSVATAVRYFELDTGWQRRLIDGQTRLWAFRLPNPRFDSNFEDFEPFGGGS
jgi:hypothetical protein